MAQREYTGKAPELAEIVDIQITRLIAGARYGVRAFNQSLMSTVATDEDTLTLLLARLQSVIEERGYTVTLDSDVGSLRVTGLVDEAMGWRIDATPACFVSPVIAGRAPTSQQFLVSLPVGTTGGTWTLTFDFGSGDETTSGISWSATDATVETAIEALATPAADSVTVQLLSPGNAETSRQYVVTIGGAVSGTAFTVEASGAGLTGISDIDIATVQAAGGESSAVQALWYDGLDLSYGELQLRFSRGGVTSAWVGYVNAFYTSGTQEPAMRAAIDSVIGVGAATVTIYHHPEDLGGVIVLDWISTDAQAQVVVEAQYQPAGYSNWNSWGASSEEIRAAGSNQDEIILVYVPESGGVFGSSETVTWDGNTGTISTVSSEATLDTAWDAITSGSTVFRGPHSHAFYLLMFDGTNANTNVPLPTSPGAVFAFQQVVAGQALINEIQQIIVHADSGTFTLSSDGTNFTSALTVGLSAATLQTALRGLAAIGSGNCDVTGAGTPASPFLVEYVSGKAATEMPLLVATEGSLVGGYDPSTSITQVAIAGIAQVDKLWLDPNAVSGYIKATNAGDFSGQIEWDATAGEVETALELIASVAAWGVTVSGEDGGPYLLSWTTAGVAPVLTLTQGTLTVSVSSLLALSQVQEQRGPQQWHDAANWTGEVVPGSGDTPILRDGKVAITGGLRQVCGWTRSGDLLALDGGDFVVGQVVRLTKSAGGTFPTATVSGGGVTLAAGTDYTVIGIDRFTQVCQLALSATGQPIVLTGAGTGTFEIGVQLAGLHQYSTFSGDLGLPRLNQGSAEERPRYLIIWSPVSVFGLGNGAGGSSLLNVDYGTVAADVTVHASGVGRQPGEMAINLRFDHTSSDLSLFGGEVSVSAVDLDPAATTMGDILNEGGRLLLGAVDLNNYSGDDFIAPVGITVRGTVIRKVN